MELLMYRNTNVLHRNCHPPTETSSQEASLGTLLSSFDLGFLKILGVYIYFYLMLSLWTFPLVWFSGQVTG